MLVCDSPTRKDLKQFRSDLKKYIYELRFEIWDVWLLVWDCYGVRVKRVLCAWWFPMRACIIRGRDADVCYTRLQWPERVQSTFFRS